MPRQLLGYRWLTRDPIIDVYRAAREKSGLSLEQVAAASGVSIGTLHKWEFGDTRKPQHVTMTFAMSACGYEETWTNPRTNESLSASYAKPNRKPRKS